MVSVYEREPLQWNFEFIKYYQNILRTEFIVVTRHSRHSRLKLGTWINLVRDDYKFGP